MNIKLAGGVLFTAVATTLGIAGFGAIKEPVHLSRADNSSIYSAQFYARTDINDTTKFLAYDSSNKIMVETKNQSEAIYTLSWSDINHCTISYGDHKLGCIKNNTFGTSETSWTVTNGLISANDGTNDREIQWNKDSSGLRGAPYKYNDHYPQVYFYTQSEFDARSTKCNWDDTKTSCLNNLIYKGAISKYDNLEPIINGGSVIPPNPEEDTPIGAQTAVSTLSFTEACEGSGIADDGISWTVSSDAAESNFDSTKGIHYGTGKKAVSYLRLSTTEIAGIVKSIVVNASGASGTSAKLNITVGGASFGEQQSLTSNAVEYILNGSASGTIIVEITQDSATKALYCKSIVVTYETQE